MSFAIALLLLPPTVVLAVIIRGLFVQQRSRIVGVLGILVALLALLGAWYAWAESQSIPWTVGYGVVALICMASATRQFMGRTLSSDP